MKFFKKKFTNFDIIGEEFGMKFNGRDRHSTLFGGCISIILFLVSYIVFLKLMTDYLRSDDPDVRQNFANLDVAPQINLAENSFIYAFSYQHVNGSSISVDTISKYFTMKGLVSRKKFNSTTKNVSSSDYSIPFVRCGKLRDRMTKELISSFSREDFLETNAFCMNVTEPERYMVNASAYNFDFTSMSVDIIPCINPGESAKNQTSICVNGINEIREFLDTVRVQAHKLQIGFNPSDKKNPTLFYVNSNENYYLDERSTLETNQYLRQTDVNDDDIDFYGNYIVKSFAEIDESIYLKRYRAEVNNEVCKTDALIACQPYLKIAIYSSPRTLQITREYVFMVDVLGDLGGFFDILILITGIVFGTCTSKIYETDMRSSILLKDVDTYQKSMPGLTHGEVMTLMDDVVEDAHDGEILYESMGKISMLGKILFKKHHLVLLPFVQMMEKKIEQEIEMSEEQRLLYEEEHPSVNSNSMEQEPLKSGEVLRKTTFRVINQDEKDRRDEEEEKELKSISIEEAFQSLLREEPSTDIGRAMNEYMTDIIIKGMDGRNKEITKEVTKSKKDIEMQQLKLEEQNAFEKALDDNQSIGLEDSSNKMTTKFR